MCLANMCKAYSQTGVAQVDEQFNNDLSLWTGNTSQFIVNASHQLQLNNTVAGSSYLATPFAATEQDLEWDVYVRQAFAGSANNYGRVYLLSTQENLTQPTEGYYLQLGEAGSNDAVELFRQDGSTSVSVCRTANATIASSFTIRIKVLRNASGLWKVMIDYAAGTDYVEAASGMDVTYTQGQYMGFVCVYTAGNATRFYYDDVYAGPVKPDVPPPDVAEKNDVVINEFFPDPTPPVGLPEQEFVEIYNRSTKTFDLHGWKIGDATSLVSLPEIVIHPDEYVVITSLPSLNNSGDVIKIVDDRSVAIDSINYSLSWYQDASKSGGGYSIERLHPDSLSTDIANWYVSQDESGGTPGRRNSVYGRNPDWISPTIVSIKYALDSIVIKFSERMSAVATVAGFSAHFRADSTAVLHLENLTNGLVYTITIKDLADLAGNVLPPSDFKFTYFIPHVVYPKGLIITEIMADPSPVVQLPEAEYVEIYNRSIYPVDLSGWHLEDPTTIGKLPSTIMMPGTYLVLTSTSNDSKFSKSLGVTSFPSLGNLGDRIVLRDPNSVAIDSIAYDVPWYRSSEKSDGGWSLELIDINNPCGEEDNWTASEDPDGGTPGNVNSVNANKPDLTPPNVIAITAISNDTLSILFNEKLKDAGTISLNGTSLLRYREILYVLSEQLATRTLYSIRISDVSDCNGNRMDEVTITFALPEAAQPNDIIINEILFNPKPTGSDFVELYNRSDKYINLKNWRLSDEVITSEDDVMSPGDYRVLSDTIMSMPSMPDDEGTVVLTDPTGVVIDQFSYRDDMHSPILSNTEGVSLERISPESTEWHSANASAGYSTPGGPNSSLRPVLMTDRAITIDPEVISASGFSQIVYRFEQGGMIANISVVDTEGRIIKTIASNATLGTQGSFQWDADRDEGGLARVGYYTVWFQVFDLEGEGRSYRKRIVVGF